MLISICIPAYNNARSLKTCLDSVFMQTWKDFELLISDDSTNPEVEELVRSYGSEPRLVYVHNALPLGSPVNWNNALHLAKGRYIKIMHHDDYFTSPNSLQQFVNYIEKEPSVSFFFCQSRVYFKKEKEYFIHKQTRTQLNRLVQNPVFLLFRNVIGAPSATCFKNDPLIRFDKDYKWLVDAEFYIRYLIKHRSFRMIPQPLVTVVDGEDGQITQDVSGNKELVVSEHLRLFSSQYTSGLNNPRSRLFFEELFTRFGITNQQQLIAEFDVPENLSAFLKEVFIELPKERWVKKIKKRVLTSRYNKLIFKRERF